MKNKELLINLDHDCFGILTCALSYYMIECADRYETCSDEELKDYWKSRTERILRLSENLTRIYFEGEP